MNKKTLTYLSIVLLLSVGIYGLVNSPWGGKMLSDNEVGQEQLVVGADISSVINRFMEDFNHALPPKIEEEYIEEAVSLFSEGGKSKIPMVNGNYHLGQALGVQDKPDDGYKIVETILKDNPATGEKDSLAEVKVSLEYSGGDVLRLFKMSKIDGEWKIDGIGLVN